MKERVTVYFHDTAMMSYLRDQHPLDPYYVIPHGEYHFLKGQVIESKFYSVIMCTEVERMIEIHGTPSTIILSAEDAGIIQLTSYEYDVLTKTSANNEAIAKLEADKKALEGHIANLDQHISDMDTHIHDMEIDAKHDVEDAYRHGYEEGQSDILSA